jgi:capsular exopolysaccharide synthesis family protein
MTRLVVVEDPLSPAAEAYRALRAQLAPSPSSDRSLRLLLVCGIGRDAADSAQVAANLAAAFAIAGERVTLVEANLRDPLLHDLAPGADASGLADWLGLSDARPSLRDTAVAGLQLLPAGRLPTGTNPADVFGRTSTHERLRALAQLADRTVVHVPPLPAFGDALALAPLADGTLLVVRSGATPRSAAQEAKARLERVGARLLGVVLLTR